MSGRRRKVAIALTATVALALAVHRPLLGIREIVGAPPSALPETAEALEERWDAILGEVVSEAGVVDYAHVSARRAELAAFVGTLAVFGPRTAPAAFAERRARLAYYINAYNALVLYAVLVGDVRTSVRDVRGWLDPVPGSGFFWGQRFLLDGETTSLHALENDVLRARFGDARVHGAINCASASCPRLLPGAYRAATLEAQLDRAASELASAPHVRVSPDGSELVLSAIYEWYAGDFGEAGALAWIERHAVTPEPVARARRANAPVRYAPYDWRLNGQW